MKTKMRRLVCIHKGKWLIKTASTYYNSGPRCNTICQPVAQTMTHWFFAEFPDVPYEKDMFVDLINDFKLNQYQN